VNRAGESSLSYRIFRSKLMLGLELSCVLGSLSMPLVLIFLLGLSLVLLVGLCRDEILLRLQMLWSSL